MGKRTERRKSMILVVVGPTGVGKTKLSVELAKKWNAEIINADSMQVYKDLNIGTAKIKPEEMENIPHHLFDIKEVTEMYTIYDYQKDCRKTIEEISHRGKNVILVGGSGLYIKAALYDYQFQKEQTNFTYDELTNEEIKKKIEEHTICNIHVNNRKRLIRMLNKIENQTWNSEKRNTISVYDFITIGLSTSREQLYNQINRRVDQMIQDGLIDEVSQLYNKKIRSKAILNGIGYKEFYDYFDKKISLEEAISRVKKNSRRYAKRQYTFFNHQMHVNWFETNYKDFSQTIQEVWEFIKQKN